MINNFTGMLRVKLMADYSPQWSTLIQQKPKLYYYKQIKNEYKAENYCYINLKKFQRSLLAKFRLGMFPINIELGRYQRIPREQRFCPLCDLDKVEDELHILFDCPRYCELRKPLFEQAALTDASFNYVSNIDKMKILTNNYHIVRKNDYLSSPGFDIQAKYFKCTSITSLC